MKFSTSRPREVVRFRSDSQAKSTVLIRAATCCPVRQSWPDGTELDGGRAKSAERECASPAPGPVGREIRPRSSPATIATGSRCELNLEPAAESCWCFVFTPCEEHAKRETECAQHGPSHQRHTCHKCESAAQ